MIEAHTLCALLQSSIRLGGDGRSRSRRRLCAAVLYHERPGTRRSTCEGGSYLSHEFLEEASPGSAR